MDGLVAMQAGLVRRLGLRLVVVNQLERQLDHAQPILAGRGQMLKQRIYDRVKGVAVYGVQLGLVGLLGDRRLLYFRLRALAHMRQWRCPLLAWM